MTSAIDTDKSNESNDNAGYRQTVKENIIALYDSLANRRNDIAAAVKLINDLNELCYQLSEAECCIYNFIAIKDYSTIEQILNILVWLTTLKFPNLHDGERGFSTPDLIITGMVCEDYNVYYHEGRDTNDSPFIDILKRICNKYGVNVNDYI